MPRNNNYQEYKRRTSEMTFSLLMAASVDLKLCLERNCNGEIVILDANQQPIITIY